MIGIADPDAAALVRPADAACGPALDAARLRAEARLEKKLRLQLRRCRVDGGWVFLWAAMQDLHGRPISYAGTPLAEPARQGFLSKDYVALVRHTGKDWTIAADAVGPTDEVWADWPQRHGAPAALFRP